VGGGGLPKSKGSKNFFPSIHQREGKRRGKEGGERTKGVLAKRRTRSRVVRMIFLAVTSRYLEGASVREKEKKRREKEGASIHHLLLVFLYAFPQSGGGGGREGVGACPHKTLHVCPSVSCFGLKRPINSRRIFPSKGKRERGREGGEKRQRQTKTVRPNFSRNLRVASLDRAPSVEKRERGRRKKGAAAYSMRLSIFRDKVENFRLERGGGRREDGKSGSRSVAHSIMTFAISIQRRSCHEGGKRKKGFGYCTSFRSFPSIVVCTNASPSNYMHLIKGEEGGGEGGRGGGEGGPAVAKKSCGNWPESYPYLFGRIHSFCTLQTPSEKKGKRKEGGTGKLRVPIPINASTPPTLFSR